MESMLFFVFRVSSHAKKWYHYSGFRPTADDIYRISHDHCQLLKHWRFLFSSGSHRCPVRMDCYSKCWNGTCFPSPQTRSVRWLTIFHQIDMSSRKSPLPPAQGTWRWSACISRQTANPSFRFTGSRTGATWDRYRLGVRTKEWDSYLCRLL